MSEFYHALPAAGGVLDQDLHLLDLMTIAQNVRALSKKRMKNYTAADKRLRVRISELLKDDDTL